MQNLKPPKNPAEKFYIGVDFSKWLSSGESINVGASSVTAIDESGNDVSSTLIESGTLAVDGSILQARIKDGTDGAIYYVTFNAVTSLLNNFEEDIRIRVKD